MKRANRAIASVIFYWWWIHPTILEDGTPDQIFDNLQHRQREFLDKVLLKENKTVRFSYSF